MTRESRFAAPCLMLFAVAWVLCLGPSDAAAERYVAMGDSYSAGTGTRNHDIDEDCHRSTQAYGPLIRSALGATDDFRFSACTGARINHVTGSVQHGNPPQADTLGPDTVYATISIGGNDAGFGDVLLRCGLPLVSCDGDINNAQAYINNTLPDRLDAAYNRIRLRAPNARVGVLGYPRLFPANGNDCSAATFFSSGEIARLNQTADLLANVTRARARAHGFTFIDSRPAFLGHAWCEDEWIQGLSNPTNASYHPNTAGYQGFAGITRAAMLAAPDPHFTRGPNGRIAFATNRDGNYEIYVMNGNGAYPVNLTSAPGAIDQNPVFSPDGTKLAFASNRSGNFDIYTMNSDGTGLTRLTTHGDDELEPTWAPNGQQIAYRRDVGGENNDIYRMNANGSGQTRLTNNPASDFRPDFSPDGAEIVFQRYAPGLGNEVFKMNADGQGQINLTENASAINDGGPQFSPNGDLIAFHSNRDGNFEIYTMPVTGGTATRRTNNGAADRYPTWAPSGSHIAFESDRNGSVQIFTMTSSGAAQTLRGAGGGLTPSWQGDATPPRTSLDSGPPPLSNQPVASFTFSSNEPGSTFECRLGNSAFVPCSAPHSTPAIDDGQHRFTVRAIDPSGNVDPDPPAYDFEIDTAAKQSEITAGPSGPTADPQPVFEFTSTGQSVTFECRLLAGGPAEWEVCESPWSVPGAPLPDGGYRFELRAIDALGNVEEPPQQRGFTVDTIAPVGQIAYGPDPLGADPRPTFEFESDDPAATFECRLDGAGGAGTWQECDASQRLPELADGNWTMTVRAVDQAGNIGPESDPWGFVIDTVAPATTISSGPGAREPSAEVSFEFGADEADATFECRLDSQDDADWMPCASPVTYSDLRHGRHEFQVRATDPAGNVEGQPVGHVFGVDTSAGFRLTGHPAALTKDNTPVFTFESVDPDAVFECRLDGGLWRECSSPFSPVPATLADGRYVFELRGTDAFGAMTEFDPVEWVIDTHAPVVSLLEHPGADESDASARFAFEANEPGVTFRCRTDLGSWEPCESPFIIENLAPGFHRFEVQGTDPVGHTGEAASHEWNVSQRLSPSRAIVRFNRNVRLRPGGRVPLARVACPDGPCQVRVPRAIVLRFGKARLRARVLAPRVVRAGRSTPIRVAIPRRSFRRLSTGRRVGRTVLRVVTRPVGGPRQTVTRGIRLRR